MCVQTIPRQVLGPSSHAAVCVHRLLLVAFECAENNRLATRCLACATLAKSYQGYARQKYPASGTRLFRLFLAARPNYAASVLGCFVCFLWRLIALKTTTLRHEFQSMIMACTSLENYQVLSFFSPSCDSISCSITTRMKFLVSTPSSPKPNFSR